MQNKPTISILGDKGIIGTWLKNLFSSAGFPILSTDKDSQKNNAKIVRDSSIVFVTVPLLETSKVIKSIEQDLTEDHLLVDFTSIKSKIIDPLLNLKCKLLSLHPMFAPYGEDFRNEKLIVCNIRKHLHFTDLIINEFKRTGLILINSEVVEHDRMMAFVQGITHFTSLAMLKTAQKSGVDIKKSYDFASPIYRMRISSACRIVMQDSDLYHGIFTENEFLPDVLNHFEEVVKDLKELVLSKDLEKTRELFLDLKNELGEVGAKSLEESERLIKFIRKQ